MSFYVKRTRGERTGWVGPIRSEHQAAREVAAWQDAGWNACTFGSSPDVRKAVRKWQNQARQARSR